MTRGAHVIATSVHFSLLPQLSDIPPTITKVPTTVKPLADGATLLGHDLFTNDVLYLEVRVYDNDARAVHGVRRAQGRPGLRCTLRLGRGRGASLAVAVPTHQSHTMKAAATIGPPPCPAFTL